MKQQLIQYVDLLFAGAGNCEDMKQEILQNTLDRYDDLIAEGKVPEAAYRLAIAGIGDINEILGTMPKSTPIYPAPRMDDTDPAKEDRRKLLRAIAIGLYILCLIPLIVLSEFGLDILGLCLTLVIVAAATMLILLTGKKEPEQPEETIPDTPEAKLAKQISSIIWTLATIVYILLSFATRAWHITWLIFLIAGAADNLTKAILDLKEANRNEN